MGKKLKKASKSFIGPLPITLSTEIYGRLPDVYPHNPFSWVFFGFKYLIMMMKPIPHYPNIIVNYDMIFHVKDAYGMRRLWDYGFFGKGSLSRSEPTWESSAKRRLHLETENFELTNEEITKFRREERIKFKSERSKQQELQLKKRQNIISDDELIQLDEINQILIKFRKNNKLKIKQELSSNLSFEDMRSEDQQIVDPETMQLKSVEYLQLQKVEVFFLKFALNIVEVPEFDLDQLFFECCGTKTPLPTNQFILEYVVYHHYRSLGWCVRNGIKFGCNYILYKKGPPFSHAEHGIVILTSCNTITKSMTELQTISRVIGSVKKNLVLTFIDIPTDNEFNEIISNDFNIFRLLKLYKINEILYRRWIPNRTRD